MSKKHAYLIIAHNEFDILQNLLIALDDQRNDIFVHIDRKITCLPKLSCKYSRLILLKNRVDVRWGHVSQIEAEYRLFEEGFSYGEYVFFHLISGVHLPLYHQDYIHQYFDKWIGWQVFSPLETNDFQTDQKMNRYNFFMKTFAIRNKFVSRVSQIAWHIAQRFQRKFNIKRFRNQYYAYASNWLSLNAEAIKYLISVKAQVLDKYKYSLCGDEYFVPTELKNSSFPWKINYDKRLLKHRIGQANADVLKMEDYQDLMDSSCLFARKFSEKDMDLVDLVIQVIANRK